ncbi:hypothetical protein BGW39_008923 [Mortierella sp. 14UC]|nr:hypothetical protein BGW39_008923 [Mortierella sp. 14UC]
MRNVFLSLVAALNVHKDISTQPQSIQEDHEEARSQIETVIAGEGIQLWQEFCASREYEDDDQVTPEKLLEYVDLICLPYDNMQQDATNRNRSYPQLVLSLQVLVRPVLQHWVQKAGVLKADHTFTEEKTAVDEGWEDCGLDDYGLDDYGDMDYQSECEPETSRGAYTANIVDVLDDHKDGDRSRRNVDGRESVSRLELTKKEQNSLDILSKDAAANFVEGASTPLSLVWTPGRYKADEFQAPPIYHRPYAIETIGPTIDIGISDNVVDILEEWRFGLNGTQAIQDLNRQYGTRWRRKDQDFRYQIRITVVREFKRLVTDEARPTADNHQAENAPASEATGGLSAWYIGHKTKALQYCAPTPGMPEVWDSVALDRTYRFPIFDDIVTVEDLWKFWTQGWQDGPSVRERSAKHGATWRKSTYDRAIFQWYAPRYKVVREVQKLVDLQWSEEEATEGIEVLRMREELSLEGLARHLESLYDIRAAISNAKRPNALSVLMSLAKSADACKRESSKPAPLMGHVGGRAKDGSEGLISNGWVFWRDWGCCEYGDRAEEEVNSNEETGI